jgi:hypothetical protein
VSFSHTRVPVVLLHLTALAALAAGGCAEPAAAAGKKNANVPSEGKAVGVAVVELFTSEGCSSCPPADDLLGELVKDARATGGPVYALSFHVDYWNHIGWADPYSDAAYSRRQSQYQRAFRNNQVYTPQMVVNGRAEFVGSDRVKAGQAVAAALAKAATAKVTTKVAGVEKGRDSSTLRVSYSVEGAPAGAVLNLAVVEAGLSTRVPRGENAGRSLRHENVVRAFQTLPLDGRAEGAAEVTIPAMVKMGNATVIAYVQRPDDMAVLGAAGIPVAETR